MNVNQEVAVKQLDRNGFQGNREFLVEVLLLSLLHHANLVNLVSYCADGNQRILVYEYMSNGSLEDHLLGMPETVLFSILYICGNLQENLQESLFQVTMPDSLLYTLLHSPRNSFASNCLIFIYFCKSPGKTPRKSS